MNIYDYKDKKLYFYTSHKTNLVSFLLTVCGRMGILDEKLYCNLVGRERLSNEEQAWHRINIRKTNLSKSVIIVCSDFYFGSKPIECYLKYINIANEILANNGSFVLFVRGSDDPKYFNEGLINFSNIQTIKDYSIVCSKGYSCLCIGGKLSLDKSWKIEQSKIINRKLFWEDETINFDENIINEIVRNHPITHVITSTFPSFIKNDEEEKNNPWLKCANPNLVN